MKIHRGCDVTPDGSGLACRESRLGGLLFALILGAAFVGPTVFFWLCGIWFFFVVLALASLAIVPALLADARLRLRKTNWTLWLPPGTMWINLRSYQDKSPLDTPSVIEFADSEIAEVRRMEDRYTVPQSSGRRTSYKLVSLEILLRTADDGTLARLVADCRSRPQPWQQLGFVRSRANVTLHSVTMPEPNLLRIAWTGGRSHTISPGVRRVLRELETRIQVGEPVLKLDRTSELTQDGEVDDQILTLVQAGNRLDAVKLLRHERGYTLVEAKQFVDELAERA